MLRLLFEKTGDSLWISHLDLMRVFQRAFRRAGFMVRHSQGFTPRAIVSIALPLSVGMESCCELLDVELEGAMPSYDEIRDRVNRTMPAGIRVLQVYEAKRKIKELTHLQAQVVLEYDNGVPEDAANLIHDLLSGEHLYMVKHSRKGDTETDLIPMLQSFVVTQTDPQTLCLDVRVCAQNPALNPQLLAQAIEKYLPDWMPDFAFCRRLEVYDANGDVFR